MITCVKKPQDCFRRRSAIFGTNSGSVILDLLMYNVSGVRSEGRICQYKSVNVLPSIVNIKGSYIRTQGKGGRFGNKNGVQMMDSNTYRWERTDMLSM